jgi:hypothetical protein
MPSEVLSFVAAPLTLKDAGEKAKGCGREPS